CPDGPDGRRRPGPGLLRPTARPARGVRAGRCAAAARRPAPAVRVRGRAGPRALRLWRVADLELLGGRAARPAAGSPARAPARRGRRDPALPGCELGLRARAGRAGPGPDARAGLRRPPASTGAAWGAADRG